MHTPPNTMLGAPPAGYGWMVHGQHGPILMPLGATAPSQPAAALPAASQMLPAAPVASEAPC